MNSVGCVMFRKHNGKYP